MNSYKTLCIFVLLFAAQLRAATFCTFDAFEMGVPIRVTIATCECTGREDEVRSAAEYALAAFADVNATMSDYDTESEISRLVRSECGVWHEVSEPLAAVLIASKEYAAASGGAFDITVAPLVKLWRRARREGVLPTCEQLDKAKLCVGNDLWELDTDKRRVRWSRDGVRFDLGAIAKGYAIDLAFERLVARGFRSVLVDAGGDVRVGDAPTGEQGWRLGLPPFGPDEKPHRIVCVKNVAIATSGDTERFVEIGGIRYSHIVDPVTGYGLVESPVVLVSAPTAMEADALASAVSVLGSSRGLALIETRPACAALVITPDCETASKRWQ
ncbi:MAG: FAD:protein FMN transferase [Thermoguttaceae bacterium]